MSASPKAHEPSMEEILDSIRRIISDEDEPVPVSRGAPRSTVNGANSRMPDLDPRPAMPSPEALANEQRQRDRRIIEDNDPRATALEAALARSAARQGADQAPRRPQVEPRHAAPPLGEPSAAQRLRAAEPAITEAARRKTLLSPNVDSAVTAAFESLSDLHLPQHGRTVEDLVKEILRPMLKAWLDEHLPAIVERLVQAEIERVSRNAR